MSKLDELIRVFCPDGVEYKTLGEIATDIYRGFGIIKRTGYRNWDSLCSLWGNLHNLRRLV